MDVLGKSGQSDALALRARMEAALDRRVHLFSHVKYRKHWMNDSSVIQFGILITMPEWQADARSFNVVTW